MSDMLYLEMTIGSAIYFNRTRAWGYYFNPYTGEGFGSTRVVKSTIAQDVGGQQVMAFKMSEDPVGTFKDITLVTSSLKQPNLESKNLEVRTLYGSTYCLGSSPNLDGTGTTFTYISDDAKQLGDVIKQYLGTNLIFTFNWK
ncbi:hypothetical protein FE392_07775 [Xenorhabdus sp. 12]|uniref:DUF7823 domain-containing protein n=1 Tax=Xenorhabdus santafensis TaxID=2582833 RepID=A0ABU4S8V5_9GAMM|nr:hypothetical protein [Xenorhabdus sp. 12]MDX7987229.1 hypothetical protein [Xenorhabdus sp. 12]